MPSPRPFGSPRSNPPRSDQPNTGGGKHRPMPGRGCRRPHDQKDRPDQKDGGLDRGRGGVRGEERAGRAGFAGVRQARGGAGQGVHVATRQQGV